MLALRVSVTGDAKRFALNLCPGPLTPADGQEPAPKEILAHFNPRRIYKNGSIVYSARHEARWTKDPPSTAPLKGLPRVFGATVTLLITLDKDLVSLSIDDQPACEIFLNQDGRGEALRRLTELALHVPNKEETVGFQEEVVVHEVWWSPVPPGPPGQASATTDLPAPEVARAAAAAAAAALGLGGPPGGARGRGGGNAPWMQPPPHPQQQPLPPMQHPHYPYAGGGYMEAPPPAAPESTKMDSMLSRLGGLLAKGGGGGGGGGTGDGQAVVMVNNLPESGSDAEVEGVKADLRQLFQGVNGQEPTEVHYKVGTSTALVVLASAADQATAVRALDWTEYAGKKLRLARSNKRTFG